MNTELFTKQIPKLFRQMYQGLEQYDAYAIKRAAHNLKDSCCYLELDDVAQVCRDVETSANKGLEGQADVALLIQKLERAFSIEILK